MAAASLKTEMTSNSHVFPDRVYHSIIVLKMHNNKEARWPSGRASDSGERGRGFDPHSGRRVVSLSKTHYLPKVLVIPRKRWLR